MTKLTIKRRKNINGADCIAPFIDGYNVWDIPVNLWQEPVQHAVAHAYELGRRSALAEIMQSIDTSETLVGRRWTEDIT